MMYTLGFIGCGNMASAIISGIIANSILDPQSICVYDTDDFKSALLKKTKGVKSAESPAELHECSDILFLCVKPGIVPAVLAEIRTPGRAVVSIAAGVTAKKITQWLPVEARVLRVMPNTPLMVGRGASGFEVPSTLKQEEYGFVRGIFESLGRVVEVPASLMDAVTGISGSGPAYMYAFLNALVQAGVRQKLSEEDSFTLALQTMKGAAAMVEKTGKPLDTLIREVCSPGGTTIEAIAVFDQFDLADIVDQAVDACVKKSAQLSE